MKFYKCSVVFKFVLVFMISIVIFLVTNVKANIICNDGTVSNSCQDCHRGCCSSHGGCSSGYSGSSNSNNNSSVSSYPSVSSYVAPVIRLKSGNNKIKSIVIDGKNVKVKNRVVYTTLKNKVSVNVGLQSRKATAKYNKSINLKHGINSEEIVVTAENGKKRTYYIDIKKINNNTNIKEIRVNDELVSLDDMMYESVSDTANIEVTLEDTYAEVKYDDTVKLSPGENEIPIVVIAENGDQKDYKLVVKYDDSLDGVVGVLMFGGAGAIAAKVYHDKKKKHKLSD